MRVWFMGLAVSLGAVSLGTGCAFIDPVWEFSTQPGMDGGQPRSDAGDSGFEDARVDAGPVGPGVCRDCTLGTDEGCPDGYGCYVAYIAGAECTVCAERNGVNAGPGEACSSGLDCQRGVDCIADRCRTFCDQPADCEAGVACMEFSSEALTGWCIGADCDPFDHGTCDGGRACTVVNSMRNNDLASICVDPGTVSVGGDCSAGPCAPGSVCFGGAFVCLQLCDVFHGCADGDCVDIGVLAGSTVGLCVRTCGNDSDCEAGRVCRGMICVPQ